MTGNTEDAKDLMQEVFLAVFNSLGNYQSRSSFKNWLFKIAHFKCMDFFRRRRVDANLDQFSNNVTDEEPTQASNIEAFYKTEALQTQGPEEYFYHLQANEQLLTLLQKLPIHQRLIVELKFYSQFTFSEISEQLDISTNTAKSRLYAALNSLKAYSNSVEQQTQKGAEHG